LLREVKVPHGRDESFVYESEILIEAARQGCTIGSLSISVSPRSGPSPSHFRPLLDILKITRMIGWKLIRRGMYPGGLYRVVFGGKAVQASQPVYYGRDMADPTRKS